MQKPVIPESPCQPAVMLQLPLPLLAALTAARDVFFEPCIRVGEQALHALMGARPYRVVRHEVVPRPCTTRRPRWLDPE